MLTQKKRRSFDTMNFIANNSKITKIIGKQKYTDINIAFPLNIATVVLSTSTMHDACIDSIRMYNIIKVSFFTWNPKGQQLRNLELPNKTLNVVFPDFNKSSNRKNG